MDIFIFTLFELIKMIPPPPYTYIQFFVVVFLLWVHLLGLNNAITKRVVMMTACVIKNEILSLMGSTFPCTSASIFFCWLSFSFISFAFFFFSAFSFFLASSVSFISSSSSLLDISPPPMCVYSPSAVSLS